MPLLKDASDRCCNCSCSVSVLEKAKENNSQHHHSTKVHERPELETMISLKKEGWNDQRRGAEDGILGKTHVFSDICDDSTILSVFVLTGFLI